MKKYLILLILTFTITKAIGQTMETEDSMGKSLFLADTKHSVGFKGEYIYQGKNYISLGIGYLNPRHIDGGPCNSFILGTEGFSLSTEIPFTKDNFHIIPKLGYELTMLFVATKLSIGVPTNFDSSSLLFTPELGLSFFGYGYIFYGRNMSIGNKEFGLSKNRVTLGVNLLGKVKKRE